MAEGRTEGFRRLVEARNDLRSDITDGVRFRAAYFSSPPIRHYRFGSTPPIPSRATLNYSDYINRSVHAEQDFRRPIPG